MNLEEVPESASARENWPQLYRSSFQYAQTVRWLTCHFTCESLRGIETFPMWYDKFSIFR
jgi:uncharacterized membrane protein YhdT